MRTSRSTSLAGLILIAGFGLASAAGAAKGVCKDGTPPPCKPAVELTNNLSMPAVHTSDTATVAEWSVLPDQFGVTYSYGCDQPETVDIYSYPNTSCVDAAGVFLTAAECTAAGAPCEGLPVERIYWQKVAANSWWAQSKGPVAPVTAAFLDWGDNLESVSWSERSSIRVETTPYASLIPWAVPFDPTLETCEEAATGYGLDPLEVCQIGFQMFHVLGQGPSEQWGVRATDAADPLPYLYDSPYAVIHTYAARLNMTKLEPGAAVCPGNPGASTPPTGFLWDDVSEPAGWHAIGGDPCTLRDIPFTAELNVGGRYVYGYNWNLKRDEMPSECGPGWLKAGWWRLTFYSENDDVVFDPAYPVSEPLAAPPGVPARPRPLVYTARLLEAEGPLYTPVISYGDNLTHIDICVETKAAGGGGGRGGRN